MAHFLEDCPQWNIPNSGGWTLQGHSVAGERTGFHIPELRLFLDAGCNSNRDVAALLLTHGHNDHSHNIPCLVMGQNGDLAKRPPMLCHRELVGPVRMLARASQALNDSRPLSDAEEVNAIGVLAGDTVQLKLGRQRNLEVEVRVVHCEHRIPCVGYIICKKTNRLKPEFQGIAASEIARRRKEGEQVTDQAAEPVLAFMGDTTEAALTAASNPSLLDVPVIVVECTGVGRAGGPDAETCRQRGHMHWEALQAVVEQRPCTTFVLIHFSRAVSDEAAAVREIAAARLPNVVLWFDSGPVAIRDVLEAEQAAGKAQASAEPG